jgi:hypothetical protein
VARQRKQWNISSTPAITLPRSGIKWDGYVTSDRRRDNILETIANWRDQAFIHPSLIVSGSLYQASFFGKPGKKGTTDSSKASLPWQHRWQLCYCNILEFPPQLLEDTCTQTNSPSSGSGLHPPPLRLFLLPAPGLPQSSPTSWLPPPKDFIKLNFDGASKGNPGPAGYGIVFRSPDGVLLADTWHTEESGDRQRGTEPCDGLVPPPATLPRL